MTGRWIGDRAKPAEIVAAHRHARGTLLRMNVEAGPGGRKRYIVEDLIAGRTIKRFRPHEPGLHVKRWIDQRYPGGVFMTALGYGRLLRWKRTVWEPRAVKRAYEQCGEVYDA